MADEAGSTRGREFVASWAARLPDWLAAPEYQTPAHAPVQGWWRTSTVIQALKQAWRYEDCSRAEADRFRGYCEYYGNQVWTSLTGPGPITPLAVEEELRRHTDPDFWPSTRAARPISPADDMAPVRFEQLNCALTHFCEHATSELVAFVRWQQSQLLEWWRMAASRHRPDWPHGTAAIPLAEARGMLLDSVKQVAGQANDPYRAACWRFAGWEAGQLRSVIETVTAMAEEVMGAGAGQEADAVPEEAAPWERQYGWLLSCLENFCAVWEARQLCGAPADMLPGLQRLLRRATNIKRQLEEK